MGGKGTKGLLNALFVSDIRINFSKNRKLRAVQGRNVQSCLSHKCEKPHCFQGDSFTAGIRTCNYKKVKILSQSDINGNRFFPGNQRVAGLF